MAPPLENVGREALARVREQARIQVASQDAGRILWELLPLDRGEDGEPVPLRGFLGLPEPSEGDLYLDLEGDPFALDDGVDYLFGILEPRLPEDDARWAAADGERTPKFHAIWSLDEDGRVTWASEKAAFERTVDLIMDRWARDPDLHVYHYAAYERTALGRLAQRHGTREEEVDRLLRGEVLVDLYRVVRQGLRAGVESYSIKRIEPLYALTREQDLKDAGSSIVAFETWLELGADAPVEDAATDPRRHRRLQPGRRPEQLAAPGLAGGASRRPGGPRGPAAPPPDRRRRRRVAGALGPRTARRGADGAPGRGRPRRIPPRGPRTRMRQGRWLLAQLLAWHRREDKAAWWRFFELLRMTDEELIEEREPLAGLVPVGEPRIEKKSLVHTFSFPPQDHRIDVGSDVSDPVTREGAGAVVAVDETNRTIELKRGPKLAGTPLPTALVPNGVIPTSELAESLLRTGEQIAKEGLAGGGAGAGPGSPDLGAARALLLRTPPGDGPGDGHRRAGGDAARRGRPPRAGSRGSGPAGPGPSGLGQDLHGRPHDRAAGDGRPAGRGRRQQPQGHRQPARGRGQGRPRAAGGGRDHAAGADRAEAEDGPPAVVHGRDAAPRQRLGGPGAALRAPATSSARWRGPGAGPEMALPEPVLDVLFVDEAGQMSLANVLACAPAARAIVLLGDPQQLDQPTQGSHPPGAERSALGHILGDRATIEPEEGLFLGETWRLHPEICDFTSAAFYEDRLRPIPGLERQRVDGATTAAARGNGHAARPGRARGQRHGLGRGGRRGRGPGAGPARRAAPPGRTATARSTR